MRQAVPSLLLAIAISLAGCQAPAPNGGSSAAGAVDDAAAAPASNSSNPAHGENGPGGTPNPTPHEALPLRTIMQRLDRDLADLAHALWLEDYAEMSARAIAVADHPHVSPQEMQRVQGVLGPDMARFVAADRAVHDAALRLSAAAEARDLDGTLRELGEVQRGCVACHTQFRDRLRTDRP